MLSIGKIAAGTGYRYLEKDLTYAAGEYYIGPGKTAPAYWMGSGAPLLQLSGGLQDGQMAALYGQGVDWRDGAPLGRQWRRSLLSDDPGERDEQLRLKVLDAVARAERSRGRVLFSEEREMIEQKIRGRKEHVTVAGLDLTFSPVKSVSVLFAGLDDAGRAQVQQAMDIATASLVGFLEQSAGGTRAGANGVRKLDGDGWIVASFEHHTSRAGDIQLHRHLAVLNKVRTTADGKWRALDTATIYRSSAAAGQIATRVLQAELTRRLNVRWTDRGEIEHIPQSVIRDQSKRRKVIEAELTERGLLGDGAGSQARRSRLAAAATTVTLATRPRKTNETLPDVLGRVRNNVHAATGLVLTEIAQSATHRRQLAPLDMGSLDLAALAAEALATAQQRSAVFTRADLIRTAGEAIADVAYRIDSSRIGPLMQAIADRAEVLDGVVRINAPAVYTVHEQLHRADGRNIFEQHRVIDRYTTRSMLDAEQRILAAARTGHGPILNPADVEHHLAVTLADAQSQSQAAAVRAITTGGHQLMAVEGPAGTGKSRMMRETATLWSNAGLQVLGLALAQSAARVLAEEAEIRTENIRKFTVELTKHQRRRALVAGGTVAPHTAARWAHEAQGWELQPGALVILDEASMASTFEIDQVLAEVERVGGQLVLVGDPHQLAAVDAGGALKLVIGDVGASTLDVVRRQVAQWERDATLDLRAGHIRALNEYLMRDRVHGGTREEMLTSCYQYWLSARRHGENALMVTATNSEAAELSSLARAQLVEWGQVHAEGTMLADGNLAGVGDLLATRQIDRDNLDERGVFVANRDVWTVIARDANTGELTVQRADGDAITTLNTQYLASHGELAYASTIHGAQGRTVHGCYAIVDDTTSREGLYVAMSRGTHDNHIFTVTTHDPEHAPVSHEQLRAVIAAALERQDTTQSATVALREELANATSLAALYPIWADTTHHTINEHVHDQLAATLTPGDLTRLVEDQNFPGLQRDLWTRSITTGSITAPLEQLLSRDLDGVDSPAATLQWRLTHLADVEPPATTWQARTPHGASPDAITAQSVAAAMDTRVRTIALQLHHLVAQRQLPEWARQHLAYGPDTDIADLTDTLTQIAVYREIFATPADVALVGGQPVSTDPVRDRLHQQLVDRIQPHLAIRQWTNHRLQTELSRVETLIGATPLDVRSELTLAHQALTTARTNPAAAAVLAQAHAEVVALETAAAARRDWWHQTQPALITRTQLGRELQRREPKPAPKKRQAPTVGAVRQR